MQGRHLHLYRLRGDGLHMVGQELRNLLMVLMRHQSARHLGVGLGGKHRLGTLARITAPDAADIERRAATVALQGAVTFLAEQGFHANGLLVLLFVEGDAGNHVALFLRHFLHIVIEAGHGDASVLVRQAGNQLAEHVDGIGHRAAKMPGVQVAVGTCHLYLPVGQSAQAGGQ